MGFIVIAIDAEQDKKRYCLSLGAEVYLDVTYGEDVVKGLQESTGGDVAAAVSFVLVA